MRGPVDALIAMDRLIGNARTMAGLTGDPAFRLSIEEGEKARAALAELIEAVPPLIEIASGRAPVALGVIRRVEAALARATGKEVGRA